jgi:tetratricopeptide (TPR) repeat protein
VSSQTTPSSRTSDPKAAIEALETQLRNTPRGTRPYEYAAISYRLGMAHAETPIGSPQEGLRKALAHFEEAAAIFDPRYDPVEHARVLNAAGAVHRALGNRARAASLFEKAAELLADKDRDGERAAALNNLGLVRTELGDPTTAVEAFDTAAGLFDTTTAEGRRGWVATLHNRGQAHAAHGTEVGLEAALADYEEARSELDADDAPYHYALVHHSIGVTCSALAGLHAPNPAVADADAEGEAEVRRQFLQEAVRAFTESLEVFTRVGFPFQHALAKHNLGLAYAALGGVTNLRRALAAAEDAVAILDPRLHADAWRQAYGTLEHIEKELGHLAPGMSRAVHFVNLAADLRREDRIDLVKERLYRLFALPDHGRIALTELALAVATLGEGKGRGILEAELDLIMEMTPDVQEVALLSIWDAHRQLSGAQREVLDQELDQAIGDALGGPQRVFVRDFLYARGWERPG